MSEHQPTDEQVRRLLAEARHTDPLPDDVAARLDGVLAELRDQPAATPARTAAADLATVRRRRNARRWLLAAAAAVVIGVGVDHLDLTVSGGQADSADSADSAASDAGGAGASSQEEAGRAADAPQASPQPEHAPADALTDGLLAGPVRHLDSDRFGAQVRRLGRSVTALAGGTAAYGSEAQSGRLAKACPVPDGPGDQLPVRYDGQRGVLVYRPANGDTQVVDLYLCGSDGTARSITLSLR